MATASSEKILHHSPLDFEGRQANVTLTTHYIAVEYPTKHRHVDPSLEIKPPTTCQVIPLDEVIAVQPHKPSPGKDKFKFRDGGAVYKAIEMQPLNPTSFIIYVVKRVPKHKWRHKMLTFSCKEHQSCSQWIDKIRDVLFTAETEHQYHAYEVLQTYDLSSVDGVVAVGGDGTFSEVLNGLLDRSNADECVQQTFRHIPARPRLRIGVIPAGSTDALVFSTVGTIDAQTSTLQIILGDCVGVDVNALFKKEVFVKYSVTMTSYGYYGDLLADSENLRWMGPKRYNWSGFKTFMSNKAYEGEVAFLPAEKNCGNPRDGVRCFSGCVICQRAGNESELASRTFGRSVSAPTFEPDRWQRIVSKFVTINTLTICCRSPLSPEGMSPNTHLGDGCMDLILVSDCSRFDYLRHLSRIPRAGADQFDFSFVKVFRVREIQFRPAHEEEEEEEHLGESDLEGAAVSLSSAGNSSKSLSSRKSLKSVTSRNSMWNCDGELIPTPHLHIQVHCQLIRMFARGIEDWSKLEPEKCPVCCNPCSRF
ncbi:hypothetical protein BaRGS_00032246 [Batillaria attramentaria]|uniref:DAGKc domain-containing protein n=1 Tax=Batillaria attramentaria TaxID=370345 RepID=A0ABD0JN65_9CAEN